jgi:hypothetical protein
MRRSPISMRSPHAADDQAWRLIAQTLLGADDKAAAAAAARTAGDTAAPGRQGTSWVAVEPARLQARGQGGRAKDASSTAPLSRFHGSDSYAWSARLALDRGERSGARDPVRRKRIKHDPKSGAACAPVTRRCSPTAATSAAAGALRSPTVRRTT